MIYTKFMFAPGVEWPDGEFSPKASSKEADEAVEREGEGTTAFALMGFDLEADRWEVLSVAYSRHGLVRRTCMMFGLDLEWSGDAPLEFDRGQGIRIARYTTHSGDTVIAFSGLMAGMVAARSADEMLRAEMLAKRLGVTIKSADC
jgi:hypothetical protein